MNAVWGDGFEIDDWATILTAGYTIDNAPTVAVISSTAHQDSGGRGGTRCININPSTASFHGVVTPSLVAPYCAAGAFRLNNSISSATQGFVVAFKLSGLTQSSILFRGDGFTQAVRGGSPGSGTSLAVSAGTIATGVWHWFSIEADIDNAGAFNVYVNGALVLTFSGDNQQQASPGFNSVAFGVTGNASADVDLDDIVITDNTETEIPEMYLVLQLPTGNGSTVEFTPSAGTNWENVDENPPNNTDYNETATAGDIDIYTYPNLPFTPTSIAFVQSVLYAARDGAITGFRAEIDSGGTPDSGTTVSPAAAGVYTLAYDIFPLDPDTTAAWTPGAVNALEAGLSAQS